MTSIAHDRYTILTEEQADVLAANLTRDEEIENEDAWTYTVIPADNAKNGGAKPGTVKPEARQDMANNVTVYTVAVADEDGEFVGYL